MARVESTIFVPLSLEAVFAFLSRRESHLNFIPRMIELNQTSQGVFESVGTTLSGRLDYFGIQIPVQYEILHVEANHELAMKGQMGPIVFKDGYVLSQQASGTEIKFWLELLPTGWARFLTPFIGLIGRIHAWETLRNLKRELARQEIASSSLRSSSQ